MASKKQHRRADRGRIDRARGVRTENGHPTGEDAKDESGGVSVADLQALAALARRARRAYEKGARH